VPLAETVPISPPTPVLKRKHGFSGALVVCIDNDMTILEGMQALLGGWQCDVVGAANIAEALPLIGERSPDAVIVDYHLDGGLTGLAVLDEFSARFGRAVPGIVITADHTEAAREAIEGRGHKLLYKPVRPAALRALLGRLVEATKRQVTAAADRPEAVRLR